MQTPSGSPPPPPTHGGGTAQPTKKFWQQDRFRQVVIWGAAGAGVLAAVLTTVVVVMGGSDGGGAAAGSATPSASPSESAVVSPTPIATVGSTATPTTAPTATPEPTTPPPATAPPAPDDPPVVLGGGWTKVLTELNLRDEPTSVAAVVKRLPRDELVWVVPRGGDPVQGDGFYWYPAETLDGESGWIASGPSSDPHADGLSTEDTLLSCGKVESGDGIRIDGLRAGPLDAVERGGFALAAATGDEQCVTYTLEGDRPVAYIDLLLDACGGPTWDGGKLMLKPTAWGDVVTEYKVKRTVEVAKAIWAGNSLLDDAGLSNKLKVLLLGGQAAQPFGCLSIYIQEAGEQIRRELEVWLSDCMILTANTTSTVSMKLAAGGDGVVFLKPDNVGIRTITVGQPTRINLFAYTHPEETLSMGGFGGCAA
jgi:hypothetical protein